jgi:hypothetical protein
MNNRKTGVRLRLALAAILGALGLALLAGLNACGGSGAKAPATGSGPAGQALADGRTVSVTLNSTASSAASLSVSLQLSGAERLHQMSLRLAYDPRALRPVAATRGGLVDERAVFFSAFDRPTALAGAYVPIAFTFHPGELIAAGSGGLATIDFEVLDASRDTGLSVIQSPDFLIARSRLNEELRVSLGAGDE